jgi:hypothetical protein
VALDFEPPVSAVEALRDGWRRLRGPTVAFHLDRPCFGPGAVGLASASAARWRAASARIIAPVIRPP